MALKDDIRWFKEQFQDKIRAAVQGTPYTVDMLTAIACPGNRRDMANSAQERSHRRSGRRIMRRRHT